MSGTFRRAEDWLVDRGLEPDDDAPISTAFAGQLGDQVSEAVATARRITASTPMAEARVRRKLAARGYEDVVLDLAMERARAEQLVNDDVFARALIDEGRRKGNAPARLRADLTKRDLPAELIDALLDEPGEVTLDAAAFDVAQRRAASLRGVETETAYRRLVSYLARRGYPEQLAHRAARMALFDDRDAERTAGR